MRGKHIIFRLMAALAVSLTMMVAGVGSAWSADLRSAKAAGQIGEQPNGYLGIVTSASGDVQALVKTINLKRKDVYQKIAGKNGTSLNAVEQMAGKKAMAKTPSGQFVRSASGAWQRK